MDPQDALEVRRATLDARATTRTLEIACADSARGLLIRDQTIFHNNVVHRPAPPRNRHVNAQILTDRLDDPGGDGRFDRFDHQLETETEGGERQRRRSSTIGLPSTSARTEDSPRHGTGVAAFVVQQLPVHQCVLDPVRLHHQTLATAG